MGSIIYKVTKLEIKKNFSKKNSDQQYKIIKKLIENFYTISCDYKSCSYGTCTYGHSEIEKFIGKECIKILLYFLEIFKYLFSLEIFNIKDFSDCFRSYLSVWIDIIITYYDKNNNSLINVINEIFYNPFVILYTAKLSIYKSKDQRLPDKVYYSHEHHNIYNIIDKTQLLTHVHSIVKESELFKHNMEILIHQLYTNCRRIN